MKKFVARPEYFAHNLADAVSVGVNEAVIQLPDGGTVPGVTVYRRGYPNLVLPLPIARQFTEELVDCLIHAERKKGPTL